MGRPSDGRDHRLSIRIGNDEQLMLAEMARERGQSASDFIRQLIRQLYAERPPKKR